MPKHKPSLDRPPFPSLSCDTRGRIRRAYTGRDGRLKAQSFGWASDRSLRDGARCEWSTCARTVRVNPQVVGTTGNKVGTPSLYYPVDNAPRLAPLLHTSSYIQRCFKVPDEVNFASARGCGMRGSRDQQSRASVSTTPWPTRPCIKYTIP